MDSFTTPLSNFEFTSMSKPVNWDRLRTLDLSRLKKKNDTSSLALLLDDVALGYVPEKDSDPTLYKALKLAQLSTQYIISCNKTLKSREKLLSRALETFDEEAYALDIEITRLRAREKALAKECRNYDDLQTEYTQLLNELDPKIARKYARKQSLEKIRKYNRRKVASNVEDDISPTVDVRPFQNDLPSKVKEQEPNTHSLSSTSPLNPKIKSNAYDVGVRLRAQNHPAFQNNISQSKLSQDQDLSSHSSDSNPWPHVRSPKVSSVESKLPTSNIEELNKESSSESSGSRSDSVFANVIDSVDITKKKSVSVRPTKPIIVSTIESAASKSSFISEDSLNVDVSNTSKQSYLMNTKDPYHDTFSDDIEDTIYLPDDKPSLIKTFPVISAKSPPSSSTIPRAENKPKGPIIKIMSHNVPIAVKESTDSSYWKDAKKSSESDSVNVSRSDYESESKHSLTNDSYFDQESSVELSQSNDKMKSWDQSDSNIELSNDNEVLESSDSPSRSPWKTVQIPTVSTRTGVLRYLEKDNNFQTTKFETTSHRQYNKEDDDVLFGTRNYVKDDSSSVTSYNSDYISEVQNDSSIADNTRDTLSYSTFVDNPRLSKLDTFVSEGSSKPMSSPMSIHSQAFNKFTKWEDGRASLDMIEIAQAMDVLISSLQVEPTFPKGYEEVFINIEFLGSISNISGPVYPRIPIEGSGSPQRNLAPVNFAAHIDFGNESIDVLTKEIEDKREKLSLVVSLLGVEGSDRVRIGRGVLNLWVMIEDSCNIIRQDLEILGLDSGEKIGYVVINVRGFHLLSMCANDV